MDNYIAEILEKYRAEQLARLSEKDRETYLLEEARINKLRRHEPWNYEPEEIVVYDRYSNIPEIYYL